MNIKSFLKKIFYLYNLFAYYYLNREKYEQTFQMIYSNLLVAYQEKFPLEKYEKIAHSVMRKRILMVTEEFFNNMFFNIGFKNFILARLYQFSKNKNHRWARIYTKWYDNRNLKIKNNSYLLWKNYFKYFHSFSIENLQLIDDYLNQGKGIVLCAFHLGFYRIWADFLSSKGYKVKLLVDRNVYEKEFASVKERLKFKTEYLPVSPFEFLVAENVTIGLKIRESLNNNEIILFFLDGNKGVGDREKKADIVPFLSQALYIRKGTIEIALRNGSPVLPVISLWDKNKPIFKVYPAIDIQEMDPKTASSATAKSLYKFFENFITKDPAQWDQWVDCHHFWVKKEKENKTITEQEYLKTKERVHDLLKQHAGYIKIKIQPYKVSYIVGRKGIALVDVEQARYYEVSPFLTKFLPEVYQKRKMKLEEVKRKFQEYPLQEISSDLTRLYLMEYIELEEG